MDEYIEREALYKIIENWRDGHADVDDADGCGLLEDVMCEIKAQTAADVVEVVRCKDCKHWDEQTEWCDHHSHFVDSEGGFCHPWESADWKMFDADYFCKDGERKDGNG